MILASKPGLYGANSDQLPERLQNALRRLILELSTESEISRRAEIRRIKQAHQFWRGMQYLWWSERDQNWHLPFEQKFAKESSLEDMPRYEFVTNIYQAFGLSIIAVLSQDIPRVRFFPQSAESEADVSTAKAASEIARLIEQNNRVGNLLVEEAFHLWTGGKIGAYVRYVVDGQRFGFHPETELDTRQVKIAALWVCPNCAAETAARGSTFANGASCEACGAVLTEENYVPEEVVTVPAGVRTMRAANGQEVITIVGALELKTPPWANEMHEYPFLQWNMEVHQARLRGVSACCRQDRSADCGRGIRAIRTPRATGAIAGRAAHDRRRLQCESHYISADVVAAVGVLSSRRQGAAR
jgi:ribosomal protein L37AE/L43A